MLEYVEMKKIEQIDHILNENLLHLIILPDCLFNSSSKWAIQA